MRIPLKQILLVRPFLGGAENSHKKRRHWCLSLSNYVNLPLEIAAAFRVATVAIYFNRFAGTFTRCAAVLATRLWWTSTWRVLALILFVIVCHRNFLLVNRRFGDTTSRYSTPCFSYSAKSFQKSSTD
jgi:hypothetical protein